MINTKRIAYEEIRSSVPCAQVYEAIKHVNALFANEEFYERIADHADFEQADISPESIAALMRKARLDMSIDLYYALNPLRNIDGYDDVRNPSVIHMNLWKIDRPVASLCNSMVHATVHAVNAFYDRCYFGHGNIPELSKQLTAPYAIGAIAERMISNSESPILLMEHDFFEAPKKGAKDAAIATFGIGAIA